VWFVNFRNLEFVISIKSITNFGVNANFFEPLCGPRGRAAEAAGACVDTMAVCGQGTVSVLEQVKDAASLQPSGRGSMKSLRSTCSLLPGFGCCLGRSRL
jgi:hypothetical protein